MIKFTIALALALSSRPAHRLIYILYIKNKSAFHRSTHTPAPADTHVCRLLQHYPTTPHPFGYNKHFLKECAQCRMLALIDPSIGLSTS